MAKQLLFWCTILLLALSPTQVVAQDGSSAVDESTGGGTTDGGTTGDNATGDNATGDGTTGGDTTGGSSEETTDSSTSSSPAGTYYIKGSDSYMYLTRGGYWGTELIYGEVGMMFDIVAGESEGTYTLRSADLYMASGGTNGLVTGPTSCYTDATSDAATWTFEEASESGTYYIKNSKGNYLMPSNSDGTTSYYWISETSTQSDAPTFVLLSKDEYKAQLSAQLDEQAAAVATAASLTGSSSDESGESSESTTSISSVSELESALGSYVAADVTSLISNPTYDAIDGWDLVTTQTASYTYTDDDGNTVTIYSYALSISSQLTDNAVEFYDITGGAEQVLTDVPEGIYKVTVNTMNRPFQYNRNYYSTYTDLTKVESATSYAYANTSSGDNVTQVTWASEGNDPALNAVADFVSAATGENNDYLVTFYVYVPDDGELTIGFVQPARTNLGTWTIATNWTLTRYMTTSAYYTDSLSVLIEEAESLSNSLTGSSSEATALSSALTTAKACSATSSASDLQSAYATLYAAVAAANAAAGVSAVEVTEGNYYLQAYSKGEDTYSNKFFARGGYDGTEAVVGNYGLQVIVTEISSSDHTYTLESYDYRKIQSYYCGFIQYSYGYSSTTKNNYHTLYSKYTSPTDTLNWRFVEADGVEDGYYLVNYQDYYMTSATDATYGYEYLTGTTDASEAIVWKFINEDTYDAAISTRATEKETAVIQQGLTANNAESLEDLSTKTDYTSYITNPSYKQATLNTANYGGTRPDGWTLAAVESEYASYYDRGYYAYCDSANGVFSFRNYVGTVYQEVSNLPAGLYMVQLKAMQSSFQFSTAANNALYADENAYFYANTASCTDNYKQLPSHTSYDGYENVYDSLTFVTYEDNYTDTLYVYVGKGETLTLGAVLDTYDSYSHISSYAYSGHQYLSDWQLTLLEPEPSFENPSTLSGSEVDEGTYYLQAVSQPTYTTDEEGNDLREQMSYKFLSRGGSYGWEAVVSDFGVAQVITASDSIGTGNYYSLYSHDLQVAWNNYNYCYLADDGAKISTGETTKGQWRLVEVSSDEDEGEDAEDTEGTKSYYLVGLSVSDSITTTTDDDGNTTADTTQVYTDYYLGALPNEVNDYTYYYLTPVSTADSAVIWQLIDEDAYDALVEARLDEQATDIYTLLKEEVGDKISDDYAVSSLDDLDELVAAAGAIDMTDAITNADYTGTGGWTYNSICPIYKNAYTGSINTAAYHVYENVHRDIGVYSATGHAAQIVQRVTGLESGLYEVDVAAMQTTIPTSYYTSRTALPACEENLSVVFASAGSDTLFKQVESYADGGITFSSDTDDDVEFALYLWESGAYNNKLYVYVSEGDTLSIGVTMPGIARHSTYTSIFVGPWTLTKVLVGKDIMEPDYTPGDGWFVGRYEFDPGTSADERVAEFTFALPDAFNMTDDDVLNVLTTETCSLTITQNESIYTVTTTPSADQLSYVDTEGDNKQLTLRFSIGNNVPDPVAGTQYTVSIPESIYGFSSSTDAGGATSGKQRASYRADAVTQNDADEISFSVSPVADYLDDTVVLMEHRTHNSYEYRFLNQGGAWSTEAIRGEVARPVQIQLDGEGSHVIRNVDLSDYRYPDTDTASFYMYYVHNDVPGFYMDSTSLHGLTDSHRFQFVRTGKTSGSERELFYLCQQDNRYYDWNNNWTVSEDDTLYFLGTASYTNEVSQYTYQYMKRYVPTLSSSYNGDALDAYSYSNLSNLTAPDEAIVWEIMPYEAYQDTIRYMQYNNQPWRSVRAFQAWQDYDELESDAQKLDSTNYFVAFGEIESWTNNGQFTEGTAFRKLSETLRESFYSMSWSKVIENPLFTDGEGWTEDTKFITDGVDGFQFDTVSLDDSYFSDSTIVVVSGVGGYSQSVTNLPAGFYRLSVDALYLPTGLDNFLSTDHSIEAININQAPTCFAFLQAKPASSSSSITTAITRIGAVATLDTVTYIADGEVQTGLYSYPYNYESTLGATEASSTTATAADDDDSSATVSFRDDFLSHFNTSFYIYLPEDYTLTVGFASECAINAGSDDGSDDGSTMVTSDWTLTYLPAVPCALEDPTLSMTDGEVVPSNTAISEFTVSYPNAWTIDTCYAAIYGIYDYTSADTYADQQTAGTDGQTSFYGRVIDWGNVANVPFSTDDDGNYTYDDDGFLEYSTTTTADNTASPVATYTGSLSVSTYSAAVDAAVDAVTDEVDASTLVSSISEDAFYHTRGLKLTLSDFTSSDETSTAGSFTVTKGHVYTVEIPAGVYGFVYANDSAYWDYDDWDEYTTGETPLWTTLTVGTTDSEGNTTGATQVTNDDGEEGDFVTKRYANDAILVTFYVADIEGAWYLKVWNTATSDGLDDDDTYAVASVTDSLYLSRGGNYGTQAVVDTIGSPIEIQAVTGGYNLRFLDNGQTTKLIADISESNDTTFRYPYASYLYADFTKGNDIYTDGHLGEESTYGARFAISRYATTEKGDYVYALYDANDDSDNNGNEVYRAFSDSLTLDVSTTGGAEQPIVWQLIPITEHRDNYIATLPTQQVLGVAHTAEQAKEQYASGLFASTTSYTDTTAFHKALNSSVYYTPVDVTLTSTLTAGQEAFATGNGAETAVYSHTLTNMPEGIYKFSADAFFRSTEHLVTDTLSQQVVVDDDTIGYGDLGRGLAYISANDQSVQVKSLGEDMTNSVASGNWTTGSTFDSYYESLYSGYYYANTIPYALATFNNGQYDNDVYVYVEEGGTLDLSIFKANGYTDSNWLFANNTTLTWYSDRLDVTFNSTGYCGLYYEDFGLQIPRNSDTGEDSLNVWTATATYSSEPTFTVDMTQQKNNGKNNGTDGFGEYYTIVPPKTPVYLEGTAGTTYSLRKRYCNLDAISSNLVGSEEGTTLSETGYKYYQFSTKSGSTDLSTLGFYWASGSNQGASITLAEHKVALRLAVPTTTTTTDNESYEAKIVWHYYGEEDEEDEANDATAITDINAGEETGASVRYGVYTLTGIRVADEVDKSLPAGIYIIDGKKTLIK